MRLGKTKIIGICDYSRDGGKSRFVPRLSFHLDEHFGNSKVLSRRNSFASHNKSSMSIDANTSFLADTGHTLSRTYRPQSVKPCLVEQGKQLALADLAIEKPIFNWSAVSKTLEFLPSNPIDFLLIDTDFDKSFISEVKVSSIKDILVVLDHRVRQDSASLLFVKSAVEQIVDCRIGVIIDAADCLGEALDIYSHFEISVGPAKSGRMRFLGHLPQTNDINKYCTLETMALQNIALALLDLKSDAIHHTMPLEMFEGFLH